MPYTMTLTRQTRTVIVTEPDASAAIFRIAELVREGFFLDAIRDDAYRELSLVDLLDASANGIAPPTSEAS